MKNSNLQGRGISLYPIASLEFEAELGCVAVGFSAFLSFCSSFLSSCPQFLLSFILHPFQVVIVFSLVSGRLFGSSLMYSLKDCKISSPHHHLPRLRLPLLPPLLLRHRSQLLLRVAVILPFRSVSRSYYLLI